MKLTREESLLVLKEAKLLQAEYASSGSRLGQSIHWLRDYGYLQEDVHRNLDTLLNENEQKGIDFYHWTDDNKVLEAFYEHFVE